MSIAPRGLFERSQFKGLPFKVPAKGDILISKIFSASAADNAGAIEAIRFAQAMFSHQPHGSRNSEHAGIVLQMPDRRRDESILLYDLKVARVDPMKARNKGLVAESDGGGIGANEIDFSVDKAIYRPKSDLNAQNSLGVSVMQQVEFVARKLTGIGSEYNLAAAKKSLFKRSALGRKGRAFIEDVASCIADPHPATIPRMFCSQFVVVVFEVAALRAGRDLLFNVDPSAVSPKKLESLLEESPLFDRVGRM